MEADVLVIGCGPAGIQAAMHSSRKKATTVVVGKRRNSAMHGAHIDNYFGTGAVLGDSLIDNGISQAESTGAVFREENVLSASVSGDSFEFALDSGETVVSKAVIIATGMSRKKLGVPGESELYGKGVSYCAVCDCNFYKGRRVAVVGNESEAAVAAELMTSYAAETHWIAWDLTANDALVSKARAAGARMHSSRPAGISGDGKVEMLVLKDGTEIPVDGVFIELGARSAADIAMDLGIMPEMDDSIRVDAHCATEVPGVFACGDVTGKPWQVSKAVGEGCVAGVSAADYVKGARE